MGTSKGKIVRKRYLSKNKSTQVNFQYQESELFIFQTYPYLGASPDSVISCHCYGEEILNIKCLWTSRERLISEYRTQAGPCIAELMMTVIKSV